MLTYSQNILILGDSAMLLIGMQIDIRPIKKSEKE